MPSNSLASPQPNRFKTRANALVPERCIPAITTHVRFACAIVNSAIGPLVGPVFQFMKVRLPAYKPKLVRLVQASFRGIAITKLALIQVCFIGGNHGYDDHTGRHLVYAG